MAYDIRNEIISLGDFVPHPANYNRHPDEQIGRLAMSLEMFGQPESVTVWDHQHTDADGNQRRGYFIAGHGVREAASQLAWEYLRADVLPSDYPEELALAYIPAANRLAELSDPDEVALARLLDNAKAHDEDLLEAIGYNEDEFQAVLEAAGAGLGVTGGEPGADTPPETSRADELQAEWRTELGQLWQCGPHRVICGDAADEATVERVLGGDKPTVLFTDPPYGVSIGAKNQMLNSFQPSGRNLTPIENDQASPDELREILTPAFRLARKYIADNCSVFMTAPQVGDLGMMMMMMMMDAGLPIRHVLIWKKNAPTFSMGRLDYDYQHEPILFTWKKTHKRFNDGNHTSVWEVDKPRSSAEHPTMKPVELYEIAYNNHSDAGDFTYEMYCGSGTALIASHNTGRVCRAIEISPAYVAVILQRFKDHTGIQPELIE